MRSLNFVFVIFAIMLPAMSFAGSACGLPEQWGDIDNATTTFDLTASARRAKKLPKIVRAQVIAAANKLAKVAGDKPKNDVVKAAQYLRGSSEGSELYIVEGSYNSQTFSVVSYYGGGNHTGYVFPWGSDTPVAEIGDDSISCL